MEPNAATHTKPGLKQTPDWILALDVADRTEALGHLDRLGDSVRWVKIGLQLFTRYGPEIVETVASRGYRIFLDLKLHDIPNTVARAVQSLAALPVDLITLHGCGGSEMLAWAARARDQSGRPDLRLLAVTVLTSMNQAALDEVGVASPLDGQVLRLGRLACNAGIDGLVCSPLEIALLREKLGEGCLLVTPGVRPAGSDLNEQKRVMTPAEAVRQGADLLVVGRPVLAAPDPRAAALALQKEILE